MIQYVSRSFTTMRLFFNNLESASEVVIELIKYDIAAIELVNKETAQIINKRSPRNTKQPEYDTLLVEFSGDNVDELIHEVKRVISTKDFHLAKKPETATSEEEINRLWKVRKNILPIISRPGSHLKALPVINDIGVPPKQLAKFIADLRGIFLKHSLEVIMYGHAGSGNLHLRPLFDVKSKGIKKRIASVANEVYDLVINYDGTITAEHGMGRLRAPFLKREWGSEVYGYMKKVKDIFDPDDLFNPGVMFSDLSITENMRQDIFE